MTRFDLPPGEVYVWWSRSEAAPATALDVLTADERERHARFHYPSDRDSYLAAHAMLRLLLERYGSDLAHAPFDSSTHGKPYLAAGPEFNLSHTHGLVACAFAAASPVGVDVETVQRTNDWRNLLRRVLHREEIESLLALPDEARQPRFYELWTLKEAWAKATGTGLHTDFRTLNALRPPEEMFLSLLDAEVGFKMAVAALGRFPRVVVRSFEWA